MEPFVKHHSIVRKIWGQSDTILFIFAGAAAEFALNKAVDWLFFTGRLPADPLGRLFSTVSYAKRIVFSTEEEAYRVIDRMAEIHVEVEEKRGKQIPSWAYRDVLYMLIDYSIRSYELLYRPLSLPEKEEVFFVFRSVGARMGIPELPERWEDWMIDREKHIHENLAYSDLSKKLFVQYRRHLGFIRYRILLAGQGVIAPERVRVLLSFNRSPLFLLIIRIYKQLVRLRLDWYLKSLILPQKYFAQVRALDS